MRALLLLPMAVLFGCAHSADEQVSSTPAPAATAQAQPETACAPIRVHFAFDSDVISEEDQLLLDGAAKCLSSNQRQRVSIEGNADQVGSEDYNRALGERRAAAVAAYLEDQGVSQKQVQAVVSNGKDKLLCTSDDEGCRARNRRTAVRATCHL